MVRRNRGDFDPALEFRVIRVAARAMPARVEQSSTDRQRDLILKKGLFPSFWKVKRVCARTSAINIPIFQTFSFVSLLQLSAKSWTYPKVERVSIEASYCYY